MMVRYGLFFARHSYNKHRIEMEVLFSSLEDDDMEEDAIHEFERSLSSFMNSTTRLYDDTRRIQNSSMEEVD